MDIAKDANKLALSHLLTRLTSRECKTRRTLPSNTGSKWPTRQTTATRHSKQQEQYQSNTEANSKHWFTTARSVPLKMSIGSVLKHNDLVEVAVLPRSSVAAYREGIKLLFLRRQQVRCSGRRREAWVNGILFLFFCFDSTVSRWLTLHKQQKQPMLLSHSSGAMWESRWPSWAGRPNVPSGLIIIIIRNSYIAPNPTWLAQSTSQFQNKNGHQNQYMKHAYTRRSNVNSKAQANMHTSWNHQCNPDMQGSNTWTMDTSHDCKSNTKSNKNWFLLEGLREQVGFQLWLKWGVCLRVADGERQIIAGYGTLIG